MHRNDRRKESRQTSFIRDHKKLHQFAWWWVWVGVVGGFKWGVEWGVVGEFKLGWVPPVSEQSKTGDGEPSLLDSWACVGANMKSLNLGAPVQRWGSSRDLQKVPGFYPLWAPSES